MNLSDMVAELNSDFNGLLENQGSPRDFKRAKTQYQPASKAAAAPLIELDGF